MFNRRVGAATALLLLALACRDSTAPEPLSVQVRVAGPPTYVVTETPNGPRVECTVEFVAETRGRGEGGWSGASFSWYFGRNRVEPMQVDWFEAGQIHDSWGGAEIDPGQPMRATWDFTAGAPFEVEASFHYYVAGETAPSVATTRFTCGPPPPASGTAPPTITGVTLSTDHAEVQPGDALTINYNASAPGGLWASGVTVNGAFRTQHIFSEKGATSANRTLTLNIPGGLSLNGEAVISVFAIDLALADTVLSPPIRLRVVDRTPPRIREAYLRNVPGTHLAGQLAVGEVLPLSVTAVDNNALAWLIFSLGAPANIRDSVPAPPLRPEHTWNLGIQIPPEWVGSPLLSIQVRDAAGLTSPVTASMPDSLRFYPTVNYPVTSAVPLPDGSADMGDMSYDAQRALMYIAQPNERRIAVLSVATMTFGASIPLPSTPAGIDLSPGGDSLIVAFPDTRSLGVIRLREPTEPIAMIPLTVLDTAGSNVVAPVRPWNVRVASTGVAIVTLTYATRSLDQVISVDLRTGAQRIRSDARGTYEMGVRSTEHSHDRSRIVIMARFCARTYIAATDSFTPCADVAWGNGAIVTFDAAASRVAYGELLFDAELRLLRKRISSVLALTPDGAAVFEGAGGYVRKARAADGIIVERFPIPVSAGLLYVTPDGKWLLVFEHGFQPRVARVELPSV